MTSRWGHGRRGCGGGGDAETPKARHRGERDAGIQHGRIHVQRRNCSSAAPSNRAVVRPEPAEAELAATRPPFTGGIAPLRIDCHLILVHVCIRLSPVPAADVPVAIVRLIAVPVDAEREDADEVPCARPTCCVAQAFAPVGDGVAERIAPHPHHAHGHEEDQRDGRAEGEELAPHDGSLPRAQANPHSGHRFGLPRRS